jgi:hypothetical protein
MQVDGNGSNGVAGWPCRDQMGRVKDDPSTGVQASAPSYWWNNTVKGIPNTIILIGSAYSAYIVENEDYCNHNPSTSFGSVSAWSYVPYTYPHSLQQGIITQMIYGISTSGGRFQ